MFNTFNPLGNRPGDRFGDAARLVPAGVAVPVAAATVARPVLDDRRVSPARAMSGGEAKMLSISLVMPNYNHAHFLERSLGALFEQAVQPDEIIIVDDASTDGSIELIERLRLASRGAPCKGGSNADERRKEQRRENL